MINKMNPIGYPDVKRAVESEENEESNENTGNTSEVSINKEVLGGRGKVVVEPILIDINAEEDTGGDEENVVVDKIFSNGIVECRKPRRSGIKLREGMYQ